MNGRFLAEGMDHRGEGFVAGILQQPGAGQCASAGDLIPFHQYRIDSPLRQ